ncbi:MAG: aldo/keto reductase [Spirochaetes bacterium]|nr:aldo/keto reductase [Spirochaetota bacterium]
MIYRTLGKTDIKLSAITFGAWAIGGWSWGGTDKIESIKAINKSYDLGVTSIDTAPVYGFGLSEEIISEAIKGRRDKFQILTKCGVTWDLKNNNVHFDTIDNEGRSVRLYKNSSKESIIKECERSLKRLKTDYIDLYQIHWHDETSSAEESMEAFQTLQKQGKIRAGGVSNYSLDNLIEICKNFDIVSNQVPFSMLKKDYEENVIPYCIENNISIIAYSPLQRGLLTGKIKTGQTFPSGDNRNNNPYFKNQNIERINDFLDKIRFLAEKRNISLGQLVINWTIQRKGITIALVGARNEMQAEENAKACDFMLTEEEIKKIDECLVGLKLDV